MNTSSLQRVGCALLLLSLDSVHAFAVSPKHVRAQASTPLQLSYLEAIECANLQHQELVNNAPTPQHSDASPLYNTIAATPAIQDIDGITTHEIVNKCFQLEEQEDACQCLTEIRLNPDHTLSVGMTDGPPHIHAEGTWTLRPEDNAFAMMLQRVYGTGRKGTDMGEFSFQVERHFVGEIDMIGETATITGEAIEHDQQLQDATVGYFSMIDISQSAESSEERFARQGVSQSSSM